MFVVQCSKFNAHRDTTQSVLKRKKPVNLLNKELKSQTANEVLTSDITYIEYRTYKQSQI